jgi:hypothetical protein
MSQTQSLKFLVVIEVIVILIIPGIPDPYPDTGESGDSYDAEMTYAV